MYYHDYAWVKGIPMGLGKDGNYRIIMDPYRKWISIELYDKGIYQKTIYDSHLLNFRYINSVEQAVWQKVPMSDNVFLIRNQDDRALFFETYTFEGNKCRECKMHSVHGVLISVQKIYYRELGDSFNGVVLFDSNNHPVMYKKYDIDKSTGEFTDVLEEQWDLLNSHLDLSFCQTGSC